MKKYVAPLSPSIEAELKRIKPLFHPESAQCQTLSAEDLELICENSRSNIRHAEAIQHQVRHVPGVTYVDWMKRDHKVISRLVRTYLEVATLSPEARPLLLGLILWQYSDQLSIVENLSAQETRETAAAT